MNQQDLNALTEFWHRETNHLNDSIDSAFKSAQDDAYARGYRRGREDLIDIRKQRDEYQSERQREHELMVRISGELETVTAQRDELLAALKDIADDYADRFDMESPSTNPGIKLVTKQAISAIARVEGQQ